MSTPLPTPDTLGWLASALVLATFCMRGMVALRLTAIASNLAFIAYGSLAGIDPVLLLHVLLLPLNAARLVQERQRPPQQEMTR
jgi:CRP/FNR family transcriptional regulator, cyclic AMP receptor protein